MEWINPTTNSNHPPPPNQFTMPEQFTELWLSQKGTCGHCRTVGTPKAQFCRRCHGWLRFRKDQDNAFVSWQSFAINAQQPQSVKEQTLRAFSSALGDDDANVALLAVDQSTKASVVVRRRAGQDLHLSRTASGQDRVHARGWGQMTATDWEALAKLAGTFVPRSESFPLPSQKLTSWIKSTRCCSLPLLSFLQADRVQPRSV